MPVRKASNRSKRNMIVDFPLHKMKRMIAFKSLIEHEGTLLGSASITSL
jgi:hypothetical protein